MSYFLCDQSLVSGSQAELTGEEARHILLSRRMRTGERLLLQDSSQTRYEAEVVKAEKDRLMVKILQSVEVPAELPVPITLYVSYLQEKALDFVFQKSTELGCARIVLFNSTRTATKLSADQFQKKYDRWNKILWEAAKQCGRSRVPELVFLPGVDEVMNGAKILGHVFLCDSSGSKLSPLTPHPSSLGILIGPEGGFSPEEVDAFKRLPNVSPLSLSPFTLRAETAALAALTAVTLQE